MVELKCVSDFVMNYSIQINDGSQSSHRYFLKKNHICVDFDAIESPSL